MSSLKLLTVQQNTLGYSYVRRFYQVKQL